MAKTNEQIAAVLRAAGLKVTIATEVETKQQVSFVAENVAKKATVKEDATDRLFKAIFNATGREYMHPNYVEVAETIKDRVIKFETENIELLITYHFDEETEKLVVDACTKNGENVLVFGAQTRIENLLNRALEGKGIKRAFKSVATWFQSEIPIYVWRYQNVGKRAGGSRMVNGQRALGVFDKLEYEQTIPLMRRESFAHDLIANRDLVIVKIAEKDEKVTAKLLSQWLNKEEIPTFSAKKTKGFIASLRNKFKKSYPEYETLGGSPDKGIVILIRKHLAPKSIMKRQKLAKILLIGGIRLHVGDLIKAKLVNFKSRRNGVPMLWKAGRYYRLMQENGIPTNQMFQGRYYDSLTSGMKGMFVTSVTDELKAEWIGVDKDIDVLIEVNEYNDIFGKGKLGDVVDLDPSNILVHKTNAERSARKIKISSQALLRAPLTIKNVLVKRMDECLDEYEDKVKTDPLSIVDFGFYKTMRLLGVKPCLDREGKIGEGLRKNLLEALMRDKFINGASEFLIYDNKLLRTEISVPRNWKVIENGVERPVKIGDKVYMLAYPLLYGTETAFSLVVAHLNKYDHVCLHADTAEIALRDEDGDRPIFILPEQVGYIWQTQGQNRLDHVKTKTAVVYDNGEEAWCNLVSDVGRIDNAISNLVLYDTNIPTPTGEELRRFGNGVIQGGIYRKKHQIDAAYDHEKVLEWIETVLAPELFDTLEGEGGNTYKRLIKHPIMLMVGAQTLAEHKKYLMGVPLNFIARPAWERIAKMEVPTDGFVKNDYYKTWAGDRLADAFDAGYISVETITAIGEAFDKLDNGVPDNATFDQKIGFYRELVEQYRIKSHGSKKAMAMLWLLLISTYPQYMWVTLTDISFIVEMVDAIEKDIPAPSLQLNAHNKERKPMELDNIRLDITIPEQEKKICIVNGWSSKIKDGNASHDDLKSWLTVTGDVEIRKTVMPDNTEVFEAWKDDIMLGHASIDSISLINKYNIKKVAITKAAGYVLMTEPYVDAKEVK